jgi:hypothetical protein
VVVLEGAHLLELLLHSPATFERELEQLAEFIPGQLPIRIEDLDEARDRLSDGLAVAGAEVGAEGELTVDELGEVVLAQLAEGLGEVVDDEPIVSMPSREVTPRHHGDPSSDRRSGVIPPV